MPKYQKQIIRKNPEKVIREVAKNYGIKPDEVLVARARSGEAREVAIYLLRKESGLSLREIGKRMGVSLGAVWHHWARTKRRLAEDKDFAKKILTII
jgi:chromosomal replication initiation ATPase DnaA